MINIKLDIHPKPRKKEVYNKKGIITNILSDEYKDDLRDMAKISIENSSEKFPVKGNVSILINYYSCRNLNIQGLVKNTLDSLNGIVITDDDRVNSLLAKLHPSDGPEYEKTTVDIIPSRPILSLDNARDDYKYFTVLSIELDSVLEDRYLPYPTRSSITNVVGVNDDDDKKISSIIQNLYEGETLKTELEVAATFSIGHDDKGDIDNYSMNYLNNLKGIVFEDLGQVTTLLLNKIYTSQENLSVDISIKEKKHI